DLPHHAVEIPFNNFDEKMLEGFFTYIKEIDVKDTWKDRKVFLRFEGIAHQAHIYLNKKLIKHHIGGYIPCEVDLSSDLNYGSVNEIMVKVDSHEDPLIPPFGGVVDYLGYSGIYREVSLVILDDYYMKDVFVHTDGKSRIYMETTLSKPEGILVYKIKDKAMEVVSKGMVMVDQVVMKTETFIEQPERWDIDNPYLYTVEMHYEVHTKLVDSKSIKIGIRHAIFEKDGFYLNHQKVKLIGLNRHQSFPYVGYAMPKSMQYEDADILKYDLGLNIVRTSHYPQSIHFLNRADEIGLLVFEEIPGWQHIGDEAWKNKSLHDLEEMIMRDRNHPSIILWGVRINESPDNINFYSKTNELARTLDPTRQTGGVRNIQFSEFLEDVYTYNDFSHTGQNRGLELKKKITKDVPYLVTEYNGHMFPTKRYDHEAKRLEHTKRHLNVLNAMMDKDNGISGSIGWCMNDYNTHQEFGSGDKICYHGVLDMFRVPKMAAYAYSSQHATGDVLEVLSTMNLGEYQGGLLPEVYIATNLDYIKLYKNDTYIDTFYPDKKTYPHLVHPPIIIKDFIGESLAIQENMKKKDAEKVKQVFKAISTYGNRLPFSYKLKMLFLLKKYKMTIDQGIKMFYKYTSGWGSEKLTYRFEGYKDHQLVKEVHKENITTSTYELSSRRDQLFIDDTYDVLSFHIKKVDSNNQLIPYAFDSFTIEVSGAIKLIGPNKLSLVSGAVGFYVKSSEKGIGHIKITFNDAVIERQVIVHDTR
ncbi:MAG: glycoside hydrolase family 2 TIM barrel-domain containing protein, partial [Acholeplasmataceae bacterium]|nr:glycoside hydrolase family 2 TIM barrel-domain containing protein [Acholeplasmataceae bacterium]